MVRLGKTDMDKIMKMFRTLIKKDLVPRIEEFVENYTNAMSDPEDPIHVHVITDDG